MFTTTDPITLIFIEFILPPKIQPLPDPK